MIQEFAYGIIPLCKNLDGEYETLIIKQKKWWHRCFPKWHIEFAETPLQAAHRELHEEAGITDVDIDEKAFFELHYNYTDTDRTEVEKYVWFYLWFVKKKDVQLELQEIEDFKRVLLSEAINEVTYLSTKDLVQKVKNYLKIWWYIS